MSIRILYHLLNLTFWLFALLILGATIAAVALLVLGEPILTVWTVAGSSAAEFALPGYAQADALIEMNRGSLTIESDATSYGLLRILDVLMRGVLWLPAVWLLRRIASHVLAGHLFSRENFQQMRRVAYLLMAIPVWQLVNSTLTQYLLLGGETEGSIIWPLPLFQVFTTTGERLQILPELNLWFLVAGLVTWVLADIFQAGFALQQDSDAIV